MSRQTGRSVAAVTAGSLALPLSLGAVAGLATLSHRGDVEPWVFVLFVAGSLSVTACPVLALILKDRGMDRTVIGTTAMSAAAASDGVAWVLLAIVASAATGTGSPLHTVVALAVAGVSAWALRAVMARVVTSGRLPSPHPAVLVAIVLAAVAAAAAASDAAGLHAVIGPLLLGVATPRTPGLSERVERHVGHVARAGLLPFFFLGAGSAVVGLLDVSPLATAGLVAVAVVGKVVGASVPARLTGAPRPTRRAWACCCRAAA
ncbi:hypothetical protein GCM10025868_26580 [Angustibacter aerolatus]|uniref:Cation/H+ exchanger transmembrane domain-containing protein n=1 Tax=Angustibacter aerolatus TaxID=1162965 RepID=A0ABQ6JJ20_9ACTN|nr:hypothetical protein GCM10025868_26580 [Angustibacter aerolatus]